MGSNTSALPNDLNDEIQACSRFNSAFWVLFAFSLPLIILILIYLSGFIATGVDVRNLSKRF